jgi:hypothetical protein
VRRISATSLRQFGELGWQASRTRGRPTNLLNLHRLQTSPTYSTNLPWHMYETVYENMPNLGQPAKKVGRAGPTLSRFSPCFVAHHPLVSYCLWLCLILDIMKICMDFSQSDAFSIIWCSWNSKSTKLMELISNKHLSSISRMKFGYVGGRYVYFMTANTPLPHTLRVLLVPEQKKRIKSCGHKQEL